jgi:hypothetical protein
MNREKFSELSHFDFKNFNLNINYLRLYFLIIILVVTT